jgi:hypothetical protein
MARMPSTLAVLAVLAPAIASAAPLTTVIHNATVVPMDGEHLLPHQDVVIGGDRIVAVRPTGAPVPAGATPARLAQAEAALDAGDRARAEPIFYELQRLLPYDARPRLRLAELQAARAAPRFEPIGTWRPWA